MGFDRGRQLQPEEHAQQTRDEQMGEGQQRDGDRCFARHPQRLQQDRVQLFAQAESVD